MPVVHYKWDPNGPPPPIQQHSIAKHEILRAYLVAYLQTLISSPRQDYFRLSLVDGFSGGGVYRHDDTRQIVLGSPFIMLQAVDEASFLINQQRTKKVHLDVDYFFIDSDRGAHERLGRELTERGYAGQLDQNVFVRRARFERQAPAIIEHIRSRTPRAGRAIFLLDQYGYTKVPTALIRTIFQELPGAEVILNFAVDSFLNFADGTDAMRTRLDRIGLSDIFRGRTFDDIKASEKDWRLFIQSSMHQDLVQACGARFFTTFFVRSSQGHGDYWLVHLSQRARARDVMTQVHWQKNNYFIHYGGAGMEMFSVLGYVTEKDSRYTGQTSLNFGYAFDEPAKAASERMLMEQIPRLIYPDADGMTFGEMFASTCTNGRNRTVTVMSEDRQTTPTRCCRLTRMPMTIPSPFAPAEGSGGTLAA